jgi:hypothetical protein
MGRVSSIASILFWGDDSRERPVVDHRLVNTINRKLTGRLFKDPPGSYVPLCRPLRRIAQLCARGRPGAGLTVVIRLICVKLPDDWEIFFTSWSLAKNRISALSFPRPTQKAVARNRHDPLTRENRPVIGMQGLVDVEFSLLLNCNRTGVDRIVLSRGPDLLRKG